MAADNVKTVAIAIMKCEDEINPGILSLPIAWFPIIIRQITSYVDKLTVLPISLLDVNIDDASPKSSLSTNVRTYLLFGGENKPWPIPWTIITTISRDNGNNSMKHSENITNNNIDIAMPAKTLLSYLSDNFPLIGEIKTMTNGAESKIIPVILESKPKTYCKWKLRIYVEMKVIKYAIKAA